MFFHSLQSSKRSQIEGANHKHEIQVNHVKTCAHLKHLEIKGCHACAQFISTYSIGSINHPISNELKVQNMCPLQEICKLTTKF
jgi:hypothetical protein